MEKEPPSAFAAGIHTNDRVAAAAAAAEPAEEGEEEEELTSFAAVEIDRSLKSHTGETPIHSSSAPDATSERHAARGNSNNNNLKQQSSKTSAATTTTVYGMATTVTASGSFPEAGSILGPYFCLGRLGKGTFSSIHKCINLQYFHHHHHHDSSGSNSSSSGAVDDRRRMAAAKIELKDFAQSNILDSEATLLDFLHRSLPAGTVPVYMGYYRTTTSATAATMNAAVINNKEAAAAPTAFCQAIFMEYLPGNDMHQLREQVMASTKKRLQRHHQQQQQMSGTSSSSMYVTRRMSPKDSVYLTAHVFLPLLKRLHEVGVVHRDVKPSNCVRSSQVTKDFCLVDFGLSKSIVVPRSSNDADLEHPWDETKPWLKPLHYTGLGSYRRERSKADFRGTSMYASLRVHQGRDYCPRDDMWSLLYVFCDLVSGGLPWMSHAANRDRAGCQKFKERVHGSGAAAPPGRISNSDETAMLLMGDHYHISAYKRERQKEAGVVDENKLTKLPEPLALSRDERCVGLLRKAFQHVAQLQFYDVPDYDLIRDCILGFDEIDRAYRDVTISPVDWIQPPKSPTHNIARAGSGQPVWEVQELADADPLEEDVFDGVVSSSTESQSSRSSSSSTDMIIRRLPLEFRFLLAQMMQNSTNTPPHRALHDWMQVVLRLLYKSWDAREYEDGGHRTSTDGFRRERYLELLQECLKCAQRHDYFRSRECYFTTTSSDDVNITTNGGSVTPPSNKRRKITLQGVSGVSKGSPLVWVSRAIYGLERAIEVEKAKRPPPPPAMRMTFS